MVSVYPTPSASDFCLVDPVKMGLPGHNSMQHFMSNSSTVDGSGMPMAAAGNMNPGSVFLPEDPNKKVRKPYTITKSRESWTEQEHDKFLEALQLFDRDWKKIEAFVGSKTVIQIRSHAQKYFLKVQKSGTSEHVPPPRPKRKAAHPYPQKATKNAVHQTIRPFQASVSLHEPGISPRPDSLSVPRNPPRNEAFSWNFDNNRPPVSVSHRTKDDVALTAQPASAYNCCRSSNENIPNVCSTDETNDQAKSTKRKVARAMPDFAQVYSFIGSIFEPSAGDHLQKLKKMDPINVETVVLLMKNLSFNLTSPEFENHRLLLLSYDSDSEKVKNGSDSGFYDLHTDKPESEHASLED